MKKDLALAKLYECGVVAIIRASSSAQLLDLSKALFEGGVLGIEVTMTTPKAIASIEKMADMLGDRAVIGVGSVVDGATAAAAIHAGADFVVSPVFSPAVVETTRKLGKISVPGAFTPTEILTAWSAGADAVKVFPATTLGPGYIRDVLAPMPFLKLVPTGGVDAKTAGDWIRAGAALVGAGSSLIPKEALAKGDWGAISASARQLVEAVKAARG